MKKENIKIKSNQDNLNLDVELFIPDGEIKGIIQLSHGMVEHKEYYYDIMEYFTNNGYVSIINDHRGHGNSVKKREDLGYFYEESGKFIVEDLYQITEYIKNRFLDKDVYLLGHSMGSLVVRSYIKKYDKDIKKLIVCGSPSINRFSKLGLYILKIIKLFKGDRYRAKALNKIILGKDTTNNWISNDARYIEDYNKDNKCGFIFTINGFINLMRLMIDTYSKKGWQVNNKKMQILFIAGKEDRIIKNEYMWFKSIDFLRDRGYKKIKKKLYPKMKHAILKEDNKEKVYKDIMKFIEKDFNTLL